MMKEIFKEIDGFNGDYYISNLGRVLSKKGKEEKILTSCINSRGYLYIKLSKNNKKKFFVVHRLVAEYFIPNTENKPFVNHIDGCKTNNVAENLEWCTCSENIKHAYDTGLMRVTEATRERIIKRNKEKTTKVKQIDRNTKEIIKVWDSIVLASTTLGVNASDISKCCRKYGRTKSAGGFYWEYY